MVGLETGMREAGFLAAQRAPVLRPAAAVAVAEPDARAATREAAQKWVGEVFFGTLLKEMRKSLSNDHLLYGGRGEEILQPQLDRFLAERLAASRRFGLAEAVAEFIDRRHHLTGTGRAAGNAAATAKEGP